MMAFKNRDWMPCVAKTQMCLPTALLMYERTSLCVKRKKERMDRHPMILFLPIIHSKGHRDDDDDQGGEK